MSLTPGARLHEACKSIGWSARALSERLGCDSRLVQRWWAEAAGYTPPEAVVVWAERVAKMLRTLTPPNWKRRRQG